MGPMKRWIFAAVLVGAGCNKAPSEEQCTRLLDHLIDLELKKGGATPGAEQTKEDIAKQKQAVSAAKSAEFVATCVDKTSRTRVECALAATDLDAVAKCDEAK